MDVLKVIAERISEQRYLLFLGVVVAIGTFSLFAGDQALAWGVIVAAIVLIGFVSLLDHRASRARTAAVALRFPPEIDATRVWLNGCSYEIRNPHDPDDVKAGKVVPYTAGAGWVCPVPRQARGADVIDFTFTDGNDGRWVVRGFVLDSNWPAIELKAG